MTIKTKLSGSDKCYGKKKEKEGIERTRVEWVILHGGAEGGLSEEMIFEQGPEGSKEMKTANT